MKKNQCSVTECELNEALKSLNILSEKIMSRGQAGIPVEELPDYKTGYYFTYLDGRNKKVAYAVPCTREEFEAMTHLKLKIQTLSK